ncbi:hypothetical protein FA15DRAFT_670332 [Coprinopsis marcescibilis]|uniref:Zn(2)-C6 fungal-type domain-containing protein n=1 Tax=Coprinopsis marcescibilis TaxID=230819 RepID=A0A5C3KTM4_COPMA|nr:hypothetical protein FA15DRAFT_670332 [Coprinopsis marcescibilis]
MSKQLLPLDSTPHVLCRVRVFTGLHHTNLPPMSDRDDDRSNQSSDGEASLELEAKPAKRRRLHGACDACRKKKSECDSAIMPNRTCTNCVALEIECAHTIPRRKKKDTQQEYIEQLEDRIRKLEAGLQKDHRLYRSSVIDTTEHPSSSPLPSRNISPQISPFQPQSQSAPSKEFDYVILSKKLCQLSLEGPMDYRYFGEGSVHSFVSQVAMIKDGIIGGTVDRNPTPIRRPRFWNAWWEKLRPSVEEPEYIYPEPDLFDVLLVAYWSRVHVQFPVLHRPSFSRDLEDRRHLTDRKFARVLLAACACAARYVDDERVLVPARDLGADPPVASAGWLYLEQTLPAQSVIMYGTAQTIDVQYCALSAFYLIGGSTPSAGWNITGTALRLSIEKGWHRRGSHSMPDGRQEIEKRIFWSLIWLDRIVGLILGRPPGICAEDIDVDYPIECDDEYWDSETSDSRTAFIQPDGQPSMITGFIRYLKLSEIAELTLRTIYSTKKYKASTGAMGEEWARRTVSRLNLLLDQWISSLPNYLIWDPRTPNVHFWNQAVNLHTTYQLLRIQIHRPFLHGSSPFAAEALKVCVDAARSCSEVAVNALNRQKYIAPQIIQATFASSLATLVSIWLGRASKSPYDPKQSLEVLGTCLRVLKEGETGWLVSGRLVDIISELCALSGVSVPGYETSYIPNNSTDTQPSASLGDLYSFMGIAGDPYRSSALPPGASSAEFGDIVPPSIPNIWTSDQEGQSDWSSIGSTSEHATLPNQWHHPITNQTSLSVQDTTMAWMAAPAAYNVEEWNRYLGPVEEQNEHHFSF